MIIQHVSDNHSVLNPLKMECDVIVHSGDFLPDENRDYRSIIVDQWKEHQHSWLINNIEAIKTWLNDKLFLFCAGNHDFLDPQEIVDLMCVHNINARNITNKSYKHDDVKFYGFPYISWIEGSWNYEEYPIEISNKFKPVVDMLNNNEIDVLVCHSPMNGILDTTERFFKVGSVAIYNAFTYKIKNYPKAYLCGHIHSSHGITELKNPFNAKQTMIISNAATTHHIITI